MGWAKLDDGYASHPKMLAAGLEATGLDARAIAHSCRYETDGFVSDADVIVLAQGTVGKKLAQRLVSVGRWRRDDERGGFWIHDFLKYNPSRARLEETRKRDRIRKGSERIPDGIDVEASRSPNGNLQESGRNPHGPHARAHARQPRAQNPTRPGVIEEITLNHLGVVAEPGRNGPFLVGKSVSDPPATGVIGYRQGSGVEALVGRLVDACTGENRRLVQREATDVVMHVLRFVDWRVVDEAVGAYGANSKRPVLPRALVPAVQARVPDIEIPPFVPARAAVG